MQVPDLAQPWPPIQGGCLRRSRSAMVCITCQCFRHQARPDGVTTPACDLHEASLPQGHHLDHRCHQWLPRLELKIGWCPEAG